MLQKPQNKQAKYWAEGIATFCLVFFGTGAIVVNQAFQNPLTHVGISLVFGLVVLAMIYTFGSISGAHMNPAVTLGFLAAKRIRLSESVLYILVQILGAVLASLSLHLLFPLASTLGGTIPSGSAGQSFILEMVFTAVLMIVILGVAHDNRAEGLIAGVAIGSTIVLEALVGGPISGALMNPARSLGPAIISANYSLLWIYLLAPVAGSIIAAKFFPLLQCEPSNEKGKVGCC